MLYKKVLDFICQKLLENNFHFLLESTCRLQQGIRTESNVDVIYNISMPVASTEMIANLKALREMGAISVESIMEKSDIVSDVDVEKKRLEGENVEIKPSKEVGKQEDSVDEDE